MNLVATEEEWMRIIHLWSPEFRITHRDSGGCVVTEMKSWGIGTTSQGHESLEAGLTYALKYCMNMALEMCKEIENERR